LNFDPILETLFFFCRLTAVAAGLLEGQDSDYEGKKVLSYQSEVSNQSFEGSQQRSSHKMKNKKLRLCIAPSGE
jgi:hypothetical protein